MLNSLRSIVCLHLIFFSLIFTATGADASCKVLVVMSYHNAYIWQQEIIEGIERVIGNKCELKYFSLDTKNNPQNGLQQAKEAFNLYQQFKPDAVIASDDAAQSLFVLPYLKDKVKTPVIFCGVNQEAKYYGYPASNVTGVIEHYHIKENIALLLQLMPNLRSIGFVMRGNDPTTDGTFRKIKEERFSYPLKSVGFLTPTSYEESIKIVGDLKEKADVLYISNMEGLRDKSGKIYSNKEIMKSMAALWGKKPIICGISSIVRYNCLCSVTESAVEQGTTAAKLILQVISGTPVSEIPVTRNYTGLKLINITEMKNLGIKPRPVILHGAKLVTTED